MKKCPVCKAKIKLYYQEQDGKKFRILQCSKCSYYNIFEIIPCYIEKLVGMNE